MLEASEIISVPMLDENFLFLEGDCLERGLLD
jgi:hypothetical protein